MRKRRTQKKLLPHELPYQPRIASSQRDAITGEPLPDHPAIVYRVKSPALSINSTTGEPLGIPIRLHRQVIEGPLGGLVWTRQMANLMAAARPKEETDRTHRHTLWVYWWRHPFTETLPERYPSGIVEAILAIHRYNLDWRDASIHYHIALPWLLTYERMMATHVRQLIHNTFPAA